MAILRPMPPLPPVTTATRPLRSNRFVVGITFLHVLNVLSLSDDSSIAAADRRGFRLDQDLAMSRFRDGKVSRFCSTVSREHWTSLLSEHETSCQDPAWRARIAACPGGPPMTLLAGVRPPRRPRGANSQPVSAELNDLFLTQRVTPLGSAQSRPQNDLAMATSKTYKQFHSGLRRNETSGLPPQCSLA